MISSFALLSMRPHLVQHSYVLYLESTFGIADLHYITLFSVERLPVRRHQVARTSILIIRCLLRFQKAHLMSIRYNITHCHSMNTCGCLWFYHLECFYQCHSTFSIFVRSGKFHKHCSVEVPPPINHLPTTNYQLPTFFSGHSLPYQYQTGSFLQYTQTIYLSFSVFSI